MIYTNQHGERIEISQADQMWLDDAYFTALQCRLPADAKRAALEYRVSIKGQVDHDDIPMQKIACRKFAQQQGWRVVMEKAEKGVSGSKVSASKRDVIQELRTAASNKEFDVLLVYIFDRLRVKRRLYWSGLSRTVLRCGVPTKDSSALRAIATS